MGGHHRHPTEPSPCSRPGISARGGSPARRASPRWSRLLPGLVLLWAVSLHAQTSQPAPAAWSSPTTANTARPRPPTTRELQKLIDEQQAQIEAQRVLIEQQACDVEDFRKRLAEMQQTLEELRARLKAAEAERSAAATQSEARLNEIEVSLRKKPELPPEAVSAGDFPGSFRVPGSDAAIKIGGIVRASLVQTFDALGSDDRFLTYSIPIEGTAEAGKGPRLSLWAGRSKFNFDVRTPTELGQMRAFIEGDFAGDGEAFRLRHAYGQSILSSARHGRPSRTPTPTTSTSTSKASTPRTCNGRRRCATSGS